MFAAVVPPVGTVTGFARRSTGVALAGVALAADGLMHFGRQHVGAFTQQVRLNLRQQHAHAVIRDIALGAGPPGSARERRERR